MTLRRQRLVLELKQGAGLLLRGQFGTLLEKATRRMRVSPLRRMPASQLWARAATQPSVELFVDAGLGGGSTDYLHREIEAAASRGSTALHLAVHGLSGSIVARSPALDVNHEIALGSDTLFSDARLPDFVTGLHVGTLVGFAKPLSLIDELSQLMGRLSAHATVAWHDHYLICPSHLLLDTSGSFCGVPALTRCASCIKAHPGAVEATVRKEGLSVWRDACARMLGQASEIRVFSESSAQLIRQAYGAGFDTKLSVVPHAMGYFHGSESSTPSRSLPGSSSLSSSRAPVTIGVIGRIGFHKGSEVVKSLAAEIRKRELPIGIVIVGTADDRFDPAVVTVTGSYQLQELPTRVADLGISVVLQPSIVPETFSFVAHEVVAMGLPLVTLPLGAQADCASRYAHGLVASSMRPEQLLDEILAFESAGYGDIDA